MLLRVCRPVVHPGPSILALPVMMVPVRDGVVTYLARPQRAKSLGTAGSVQGPAPVSHDLVQPIGPLRTQAVSKVAGTRRPRGAFATAAQ